MALSWAGPMAPIWLPSALSEVLSATFCKVLNFQIPLIMRQHTIWMLSICLNAGGIVIYSMPTLHDSRDLLRSILSYKLKQKETVFVSNGDVRSDILINK